MNRRPDCVRAARRGSWLRLALALFAPLLLLGACTPPWQKEIAINPELREWRSLVAELRRFEQTLGFQPTRNFTRLAEERAGYAFCGQAPADALPYSYEDPVIRWYESITEEECRTSAGGQDWYFEMVEAQGEAASPVTTSMLGGTLDRFVYLVIHEDCHDQFELPYGIEEALCNILAYRAMVDFAAEKYPWSAPEHRAIHNYALVQSRQARTVVAHYGQLDALYARYRRGELGREALLHLRPPLLAHAEQALDLPAGNLNNIKLATYMTYSRHYAALAAIVDRFGTDLERAVFFFRAVDAGKPKAEQLRQQLGIGEAKSLAFVQAYEQAVLDRARRALWARTAEAARE